MTKTLKQRRIEKGWTLDQLGRAMATQMGKKKPIKAGVVGYWEKTGRCHPSIVPALAAVLGITEQESREMMEATEESQAAASPA